MLMLLLLTVAHDVMLMLLLPAGAHILMLLMFLLQSVNVIAAVLDIDLMKISFLPRIFNYKDKKIER